ncbi:MAG: DNA repair protein RecO [Deltaproteobacteria bacterium RBG_13_43_22]|nr:MAG: DNA repair protein RecO [Deltaproteobacteria bacterium RBG_13_43_22]
MPNKSVEAIILQVQLYGEADLIIDFFSSQSGRMRGMAKGAKKSKKRFVHCLEPLNWVRLHLFEKQNVSLVRIDQGELIDPFPGIRKDFKKWGQAGFFCEMIKELFGVGDPNPAVFELIRESLKVLEQEKRDQEVFSIYQIRLFKLAGYAFHLTSCLSCGKKAEEIQNPIFSPVRGGVICPSCHKGENGIRLSPGAVRSIHQSMHMSLPQVFRIRFTREIRGEIEGLLKSFSSYIIGKELGSARYLKQLQEAYG